MTDSLLTAAVLLVVIITLGIVGARYVAKRLEHYHAPRPVTQPEAAKVVQPPTSVEEFLARYPNV